MSPGRQVLANQGSSGPYRRRMVFQPVPGTVWTQLVSLPTGGLGPKNTSTVPSGFFCRPLVWLLTLGKRWSVWIIERVWLL